MRPRLTTILILLVLGAVVNVGVAWGCAAWVEIHRVNVVGAARVREGKFVRVFYRAGRTGGERVLAGYSGESVGLPDRDVLPLPRWAEAILLDRRANGLLLADARGWPMLALSGGIDFGATPRVCEWCILLKRRSPPTLGGLESRALPLRPIPLGFAVNALFYAALLWLPLVARQLVRIRRGLCPACAYPAGESSVCTECGGKLRRAWTSPSAG